MSQSEEKERFIIAIDYLEKQDDSRVTSIPCASRYVDTRNQRLVDMRDNSITTFTTQELTEAYNAGLAQIVAEE